MSTNRLSGPLWLRRDSPDPCRAIGREGKVRVDDQLEVVRRCVHTGAEVEAVLAEISAINVELLARRELG